MIRYHLDENIPNAVAIGLRNRERDVTTSSESGLNGKSDREQLDFATRNQRVIVTRDQDMLRLSADGTKHSGIVFWTEKRSLGQLVKDLTTYFMILIGPSWQIARFSFSSWLKKAWIQHS